MSETGKDPSERPDVSGQDELSRPKRDARTSNRSGSGGDAASGAGRGEVEPPSAPEPNAQEITPADVDALMADTLGSVAQTSSTTDAVGEPPAPAPQPGPQDVSPADIAALLAAGGAAEGVVDDAVATAASTPETEPFELTELGSSAAEGIDAKRVTMLSDVKLRVKLQLGQTRMLVEDVLKLGEGSVVELDKLAGDPVDVVVNDRLVARGEVLVLNDSFCVRVSEVLSHDPHRVTV